MRLLVTADLHYNHARSKPLAIEVIDRMNRAGGDGVLVVGDTAVADGEEIEACLSRFNIAGPKLFLCGNHELWTRGADSHALFTNDLPRRVEALGWRWLETQPLIERSFAIVGTVGWYDYSFASARLGIPARFYEAKMSPGAAAYLRREDLLGDRSDLSADALEVVARWNDGKFVKLHRSDAAFLAECLARLTADLELASHVPHVVVASHHVPFRELLPPGRYSQVEFAKAYLGSERIGEVIRRFDNVREVFCGHSHFAAEARLGEIRAVNMGSSYRHKVFEMIDLPD
ncbi:MAG: metallophosphoesterase [Phycisphaerales bacterium]|nr:metallophosphoesterase [Phycisphaerales bacterium]